MIHYDTTEFPIGAVNEDAVLTDAIEADVFNGLTKPDLGINLDTDYIED